MIKDITPDQFKQLYNSNIESLEIIDVRQPYEFEAFKIPGSKLLPLNMVLDNLEQIDWTKKVIFVCRSGARSSYISNILNQNGYDSLNLIGGISLLTATCKECVS